jgi:hypothetical protein
LVGSDRDRSHVLVDLDDRRPRACANAQGAVDKTL